MQKPGKDIWVEEVISSIDNMQRATPQHDLLRAIEGRIGSISKKVPLRTVGLAAACMLLLLAVNFMLLSQPVKEQSNASDGVEQVVEYYGLNDENSVF